MSRRARLIVPGLPHLATLRSAGGRIVFRDDEDYVLFRTLLADAARRHGLGVLGYVLMPNHLHLIGVPASGPSLPRTIAAAARLYARYWTVKRKAVPPIFAVRFASTVLDPAMTTAAFKYVALNPVRARLKNRPRDWPWSSHNSWCGRANDGLTRPEAARAVIADFDSLVSELRLGPPFRALQAAQKTGRPCGSPAFGAELEAKLGKSLAPRQRGRRRQQAKAEGA